MNIDAYHGGRKDVFWSGPPLRLPDEDAHALRKLPPSTIQQWALARAQVYEEYARALRSACNAAATINHRLPSEVLMHVFTSITPKDLGEIRLMHVCRSWRAILGRTSEFWVDMLSLPKVWDIPDLLQAILLLSSPRPLAVRAAPPPVYSAKFMIPHLYRITDLRVATTHAEFQDLFQLLQASHFTNLEHLRLVSVEGSLSGPPVFEEEGARCTDAALPRLKRMELSPCFVDDHLVVGSTESLTVLSSGHGFTWLPPETISSPQALLRVLSRCASRLASLQIQFALPDDGWAPAGHASPIDLPLLDDLLIATDASGPVESFLAAVTIPPSSALTILGEGRCGPIALRDLLCDHPCVAAPDDIYLSANHAAIKITASKGGRELLQLKLPKASAPDIATALARVFSQTRTIATATLSCGWDSGVSQEQALSLLDMFPHLGSLTIAHAPAATFGKAYPETDLLLLSALAFSGSSSGAVACPALEELAVTRLGRPALLDPQALARHVASVLEQRRAVLGRALPSLALEFDLREDAYFSYEGDVAARFESVLSQHLESLVDKVSVTGR